MVSAGTDYALVVLAAEHSNAEAFRFATEAALCTRCGTVVVVLGENASEIRPALDGIAIRDKLLVFTENPRWAEGPGTSIQAGLQFLNQAGSSWSHLRCS